VADTLAYRTGEERITAFWHRIPQFFLYPLRLRPLLFMLVLSGLALLGIFLPVLGAVVWVGVALAFLRYAYSILERTAYGVLSSSEYYVSYLGRNRPWKQLLVLVLYSVLVGVIGFFFGRITALIAAYALLLLLPANVMVLAVTDSFFASLNPIALGAVILAIGWPYAVLYGFLVALSTASEGALYLLYMAMGRNLAILPAIAFSQMYFTLISFNMMGYVIYQYHEALGVPLRKAAPRLATAVPDRVRDVLRRPETLEPHLQELVLDGRTQDASDMLYELMRKDPENVELHERLHRLGHSSGNARLLGRHGGIYIALLLKQDRAMRAVEVLQRCRGADPAFHMLEDTQQIALARAARRVGRNELAAELLEDFEQTYRSSPHRPEAYLLAAEILNESFQAPAEARRLLEEIVRTYPRNPVAAQAQAYLESIDRGRSSAGSAGSG
jgi:tetratricopeptide (TPR) repeat protein